MPEESTEAAGKVKSGSEASDVLRGGRGDDTLNGLGGDDTMSGRRGDDTLNGDAGDDIIDGGRGSDILNGGGGRDILDGGRGDDTMNGGAGRDRFEASGGTDTADGGSEFDIISFWDVEFFGIKADLSSGVVEWQGHKVTLTAIEGLAGTFQNDTLTGDVHNNILFGRAGNDKLLGGAGADLIRGGLGADTLTGGAGKDVFAFVLVNESPDVAGQFDTITDFVHNPDKISLARIDANSATPADDPFTFRGVADFTAAGQVRVVQSGANTLVEINVDSDLGSDMTIELLGITATALTAADFIL